MIEVIQQVLATWNSRTNDKQKLQQTYVGGAISLLLAAGLVSLLNYQAGQSMLLIALIAFGMFVVNQEHALASLVIKKAKACS